MANKLKLTKEKKKTHKIIVQKENNNGYDVDMIKDFLNHLLCELRFACIEQGTQPDENIVGEISYYIKKRKTIGLLTLIAEIDAPSEIREEIIKAENKEKLSKAEAGIEALATLEPILKEAFECARHPNELMTKRIQIRPELPDK